MHTKNEHVGVSEKTKDGGTVKEKSEKRWQTKTRVGTNTSEREEEEKTRIF